MPRPFGTIGETKLKILAIIHYNELQGNSSYGYNIWVFLKRNFFLYMDKEDLRNVYRHLKELNNLGLVERGEYQSVKDAPKRQPYSLTEKGRVLKQRFNRYLDVLSRKNSVSVS
jgi:DNA-binding PadR family transcriptional regulator